MEKKITPDTTKGDAKEVACSSCNRKTNHIVCSSIEFKWDDEGVEGMSIYEIIRCSGCDNISFRIESSNSEDFEPDDYGELFYPKTEEVYPPHLIDRTLLKDMHLLPLKVNSIYEETHKAFCMKLRILTAVGIRALVESICLEELAIGSNLKQKINALVEKEVLTKKNADILHKTRFLGNRAAHEMKVSPDRELNIAFDIVENLLKAVYIIPKKAEQLK